MLFIIKADHSTITLQNKIIIGFLICNRATTHARCCRRRRTTRTMDYMHYIAFSCTFKQKIMQSVQRFFVCVCHVYSWIRYNNVRKEILKYIAWLTA